MKDYEIGTRFHTMPARHSVLRSPANEISALHREATAKDLRVQLGEAGGLAAHKEVYPHDHVKGEFQGRPTVEILKCQ
jgi:hypothetical protein